MTKKKSGHCLVHVFFFLLSDNVTLLSDLISKSVNASLNLDSQGEQMHAVL